MLKQLCSETPIYVYCDIVDFRKSINGLSLIVETQFGMSPFSEGLFVFCCRRRTKLKCLYWDKTGFSLWYKRLETDKFKWPRKSTSKILRLTEEQFNLLLRGVDISKIKPHRPLNYQCFS